MYLLDTHVLVWAVSTPRRLSSRALRAIESGPVVASVASYWEMVLKKGHASAPVHDPGDWWRQHVFRKEIPVFPIRAEHVAQMERFEWDHPDPYDRILCAQAIVEEVTLITADQTILENRTVPALW